MNHLNDDILIARMYGLASSEPAGSEADAHLESCASCAERWARMEAARTASAAIVDPGTEALAAQRRAIYARMGESRSSRPGWMPAAAAALLVAGGVYFYQPAVPPAIRPAIHAATHAPSSDDEQLFAEVYSVEQSAEPRAVEPMRGLFEEEQ